MHRDWSGRDHCGERDGESTRREDELEAMGWGLTWKPSAAEKNVYSSLFLFSWLRVTKLFSASYLSLSSGIYFLKCKPV